MESFEPIFGFILGDFQVTAFSHKHVSIYKAKIWKTTDKSFDPVEILDDSLLQLADSIVTKIVSNGGSINAFIIWLR